MNRALGGVIAVETETELLRQERALTYDCMLQTEGSTTSINELSPIMGIRRRGDQLATKGKQVDEMLVEFTTLGKRHEALEKLRDSLINLTTSLAGASEQVFDLVHQREQHIGAVGIGALNSDVLTGLECHQNPSVDCEDSVQLGPDLR